MANLNKICIYKFQTFQRQRVSISQPTKYQLTRRQSEKSQRKKAIFRKQRKRMTASHNLNQFCPFRTKQRISLFSEQVGQVYFVTKRTLITANQTKQLVFANLTSRIEENLLISNYNSPNLSELCQSLFLLFVKRFEDFKFV